MADLHRPIRASEVGDYVFCHRAWWLRQVRGLASRNQNVLEAGTAAHTRHGQQVALSVALRWVAVGLVICAVLWGIGMMAGYW